MVERSGRGVQRLALFFVCIASLFAVTPAHAGRDVSDDGMFAFPEGTLAWWSLNPRRFTDDRKGAAARDLLEGAMRAAVSSGIIADQDASELLAGLLIASTVGDEPHRLCVLDFAAHRDAGDGLMRIDRLSVVLEVRTQRDHRAMMRTIESVLVQGQRTRDPAGVATGTQRRLDLPGGREGVAYAQADWPAWREVSWCSTPGRFVVGIGRGTLARWFSEPHVDGGGRVGWGTHMAAVDQSRPDGDVFFGMYVDINALRRAFPSTFAEGRTGRLFATWNLSNARSFMLHARAIEPGRVRVEGGGGVYHGPALVAIDATWSARSRPLDHVGVMPISTSVWPAGRGAGGRGGGGGGGGGVAMEPPPGTYVIVLNNELARWIDLGLETYRNRLRPWDAMGFDVKRTRWERAHGKVLERLLKSLRPWIVASDVPPPMLAVPGASTLFVELRDGMDAKRFERDLSTVLTSLGDHVEYEPGSRVWSLRLVPREVDPGGVLRILALGLAGTEREPVLVCGWSVDAVVEARERLGDPGL